MKLRSGSGFETSHLTGFTSSLPLITIEEAKIVLSRLVILAMFLVASLVPGSAKGSSVDEIVTSFYPPRLTEEENERVSEGGFAYEHSQVWAPLTREGDVIAAAYSNGNFGDVCVLKSTAGRWILMWDAGDLMNGDNPDLETTDMNGDGQLDFMVTFATDQGRKNLSSLFLFDGKTVNPVSFESNNYPSFVDLDGDGTMELIDSGTDLEGNGSASVFRLTDGRYKQAEPVFFDGTNGRGANAQPKPKTEYFDSTVGSATLLVINGVRTFSRAAAVEVYLNGERVLSKDRLNEKVGRVAVPVTLLTTDVPNKITSTVFGNSNAAIDLIVYVAGANANTNAAR